MDETQLQNDVYDGLIEAMQKGFVKLYEGRNGKLYAKLTDAGHAEAKRLNEMLGK